MTTPAAQLRERVVAAVNARRDEIANTLSQAIQIESVNPKYPGQEYETVVGREGDVSKFMADKYRAAGAEVDLFAVEPGRENAVGVIRGKGDGRSLIYNGHVDVVPPGDPTIWTDGNPFSGRNDGERIWGRGASDMKSGVVAQAFAALALADAKVVLQGDLILEAVVGEEVMDHECGVTATIKRGYTADAAVVSEPSAPPAPLAVIPVSPGLWWFSVTVPGKPTHASMRGNLIRAGGLGDEVGVNAIDKGVDIFLAMRRLEDEWGQSKRHVLFPAGHFTIHPGVVTGGPKGVLVPFIVSEFMTIEYCCWYHPDERPDQVRQEIEEHIHRAAQLDPWLRAHPPVIEWKLNWPSFSVDPKHPICLAIGNAHEEANAGTRFAGRPAVNGFAAVEDCSFLNLGGIPTVSYGPGDLRVAHAYDEHVAIDEVVAATRTFALLAIDWCGV